jgi:uncharacterized protein YukJ
MPVNYGVLRGSVINALRYQHGTDHYQVEVHGGGQNYRIAVDVYSQIAGNKKLYAPDGKNVLDTDRMVMFYKDENFTHPVTALMLTCPAGFTPKNKLAKGLWLDYLRFLPQNNAGYEVFAFGSGWDDTAPGSHPDPTQYFHPEPALGIHDIHMNQGDTGSEAKYNGTWQDGALFIHDIKGKKWVAMFFRFQNQSTHTDNTTGNPK